MRIMKSNHKIWKTLPDVTLIKRTKLEVLDLYDAFYDWSTAKQLLLTLGERTFDD